MSTRAPSVCPYCGAVISPGLGYCQRCFRATPRGSTGGSAVTPGPSPDPLSQLLSPARSYGFSFLLAPGITRLWMALGIALTVVGLGLLVAANLVLRVGAAFGPACGMSPLCLPSPELALALVISGVLALVAGIAVGARALRRNLSQAPWLNLPP